MKVNQALNYQNPKEVCEKFIKFVVFFNKFINHKKKTVKRIIDKDIRL